MVPSEQFNQQQVEQLVNIVLLAVASSGLVFLSNLFLTSWLEERDAKNKRDKEDL